MQKFKKELKRFCWRMRWGDFLKDLLSMIWWMISLPAVSIFYVQNCADVQIVLEEVKYTYQSMFVVWLAIIIVVMVMNCLYYKLTSGYVYLRKEERQVFSRRGMKLYEICDDEGYGLKLEIKRETIVNFIVEVNQIYKRIMEQDVSGNKSDNEIQKECVKQHLTHMESTEREYIEKIFRRKR